MLRSRGQVAVKLGTDSGPQQKFESLLDHREVTAGSQTRMRICGATVAGRIPQSSGDGPG